MAADVFELAEPPADVGSHRVIGGHSFTGMAGQGMGESERLGVLFLAAIDASARHFGLRERSRAVAAMKESRPAM